MKDIHWSQLGFDYFPIDYNVRCHYKNGQWGELELSTDTQVHIPMAAAALQYGQQAFEGMKAYRGRDNQVRLFRIDENAKRLRRSCEGIRMTPMPEELFIEAIQLLVRKNIEYVPPFESGASLYIRALVVGLGQLMTVQPASEFLFFTFASPVGPYFKDGFQPTPMAIMRGYDRVAPLGTGSIKVGGNYAASFKSQHIALEQGYSDILYLDSREKKYLDECGPANFFGIKGNTYITPKSDSILPSITNMSLMQIAQDLGYQVERRPMTVADLADLDEAGACGTATVISPIQRIDDLDTGTSYRFCQDGKAGPISTQLYQTLRGIQYGELEDHHGWVTLL